MKEFEVHPYLLGNVLTGTMWEHIIVGEHHVRPGTHILLKSTDAKAQVEVAVTDVSFKAYENLVLTDAIGMGLSSIESLKTLLGPVEDEIEEIVTMISFDLLAEVSIV